MTQTTAQQLKNIIDGKPADAMSGETYGIVNPSTGEVYAQAPASGPEDVDRAMQAASAAFEGWGDTTQGARSWADLPAAAIKYVRRVEELIEAPVALLSTSPERADTILVHNPFRD